MTSIVKNLFLSAVTLTLTSLALTSCGPSIPGLDDDFGCLSTIEEWQGATEQYLASIQAISASGEEVSQADCDQFKSSSRAYLGALESYIDCANIQSLVSSAELDQFRKELREAEAEIESSDCN